ncbi:UTRA domain-containing protein [Tritonibacter multivorans]|nr:UTRA domain-containing protein [Tritonibacter multivorans]MDA7422026.1 UTRA domain-containing protein [Tritonibacter multivorans]
MSYRDIKKVVLDRIQNRIWGPDSLLPGEIELAEEFSSTRTTVNRALRELAEEGFLERKRKAGTRVLHSPARKAQFAIPLVRDEITDAGATYRYSLVKREVMPAPSWLTAKLALKPDREVLHLQCMHFADNEPFQLEKRWIIVESVPEVLEADFTASGPNDWLVQKVPFSNLELSFFATKADEDTAGFMDASVGDPIFATQRTTWLRGEPVTHAVLYFTPGYKMTTRL